MSDSGGFAGQPKVHRRYYPRRNLRSRMAGLSVGDMARQGAIGMEDIIRNKVGKIRHWKLTSLGKKRPRWGFEFTVMTYNILSQTAIDGHLYLYRKCDPHFLSEDYRLSRLLPEILGSKSDVVCLQEVEQHLYDQRMKGVFDFNGFESIFKKRTGNKSDGCAILWRKAKFSLLGHQEVEFRAKGCEALNKDNVGLIAVLKPRHPQATQTQLHVATTHLLFNPRRGDIKFCQLRLLLAELEKSALKKVDKGGPVYHPTVLCGDFNFEPHSPLYTFVDSGRLDVTGLVSGNMSGQQEGKGKGRALDGIKLSLDKIGIDETGRYCDRSDGSNSKEGTHSGGPRSKRMSDHTSGNSYRMQMLADQLPAGDVASACGYDTENDASHLFYHYFNFIPTYKYHLRKEFPVTSMTGGDCNTVDHIFYTVKRKSATCFEEGGLKLLGVYTLPTAEDLRDMNGLPNAHLGSDHISLMSKFVIDFKR